MTTVWSGDSVRVCLALILLLAAYIRVEAAAETVVDSPIRADASKYFSYAYNLQTFGVYSHTQTDGTSSVSVPPGYPVFVAALMDRPPTTRTLTRVVTVQTLLGVLTVLLTFVLARRFLPPAWALLPVLLAALSPHLVNAGIYLLSETLFAFCIVGLLLMVTRPNLQVDLKWLFAIGLLTGVSALIRSTTLYFPVVIVALCFLRWPVKDASRAAVAILLGFGLVWGPWSVRNASPPGTDPKIEFLLYGMYPDLRYEGDPGSVYPLLVDPNAKKFAASTETALAEIGRRFREEPGRHLKWYLVGKPLLQWSWNEVHGMGGSFVYPVIESPYFDSGFLKVTEAAMRVVHWPLVVLGALFCAGVWLPMWRRRLSSDALFAAQACAALLLYVTALHMIGLPLPRYATPFRPELYVAASSVLWVLMGELRTRFAVRRAASGAPKA